MIANRVITEPARRGRADARARNSDLSRALHAGLVLIALAVIGLCAPFPTFGRGQNSSAAALQAERQEEMVRASQAEKDVDVGSFYMHKGDYGAAISRLEEAVQLDPRYPKARLLLAESYEKQGDRTHALKTYQDYLKEFPDARDEKKIRTKIEELSRKRD